MSFPVKRPQKCPRNLQIRVNVFTSVRSIRVCFPSSLDEASDFIVLNRRFHRQLMACKDIRKLRDQYPNVQISISDEKSKSDQITLTGPSKELAAAIVQVKKIAKDLEENGYRIEVPILKQYHRNIIGKAGKLLHLGIILLDSLEI